MRPKEKNIPMGPNYNWYSFEIDGSHLTSISEEEWEVKKNAMRTAFESMILQFEFRRLADEKVLQGETEDANYYYEQAYDMEKMAMEAVDFDHENSLYLVGDNQEPQVLLLKTKWDKEIYDLDDMDSDDIDRAIYVALDTAIKENEFQICHRLGVKTMDEVVNATTSVDMRENEIYFVLKRKS